MRHAARSGHHRDAAPARRPGSAPLTGSQRVSRRSSRLVVRGPARRRLGQLVRPRPCRPGRARAGRDPHGARRGGVGTRRLAAPPRPLVRGGPVRPAGRARRRDRRRRAPAGRRRLLPVPDRDVARPRERGPGAGPLAVGEHAAAAGARRRAQGHVLHQGAVRRGRARRARRAAAVRGSGRPPASGTTTARRRRPRRCASTTRRAGASRPGWTRPCSPTAASP